MKANEKLTIAAYLLALSSLVFNLYNMYRTDKININLNRRLNISNKNEYILQDRIINTEDRINTLHRNARPQPDRQPTSVTPSQYNFLNPDVG